jgi:hypothetical protein
LTKSRLEDLKNRHFRDFAEGIGRDFTNLYIRVNMGSETFEFGQLPIRRHCGDISYPLEGTDQAKRVLVTMCRPFHFAISRIGYNVKADAVRGFTNQDSGPVYGPGLCLVHGLVCSFR